MASIIKADTLQSTTSNVFILNSVGTEYARFDSSGNMGIGTATPSAPLQVNGTATAVRATSAQLWLSRTTTATQYQGICLRTGAASDAFIGRPPASDDIIFGFDAGTVLSEKMRIDSSGNLLVGTTGTLGTTKFSVRGGGATSASNSIVTQNSGGTTTFVVRDDGLVSVGSGSYNNTTGSAANTFIDSNGYIFRSTSSLKYKKDVNDATHGLTDLLKLRSVTYKSKTDGNIIFGGFIAEEVDAAGLNEFVQYAADGSPDALNYGNMVALCVKAIQEQQALITAQASTITALTARITALESN